METIKFIKEFGIEKLESELAIRVRRHETLPLAILNYHMIDSPKLHPVTRECRGLVIDTDRIEVVARPFRRFFNLGEVPAEDAEFDWSTASFSDKQDGSLIVLYNYRNQWMVNTRGAFGGGAVGISTYAMRFLMTINAGSIRYLDKDYTYLFEFCSPDNKIVTKYTHDVSYLLGAVAKNGHELGGLEHVSDMLECEFAYRIPVFGDVSDIVIERASRKPDYEGVVVLDGACRRLKVKSRKYIELHRMRGDGGFDNPAAIMGFVLDDGGAELLLHFPEAEPLVDDARKYLSEKLAEISSLWESSNVNETQKSFALAVKDNEFSGVLFLARKMGSLTEAIAASNDLFVKRYAESK